MSKFSPIKFRQPPEWETKRLAAWLAEWNLELQLRTTTEPIPSEISMSPTPDSLRKRVAKLDMEDVAVGQIRLLSPQLLPNAPRAIYFLVLSNWDQGLKLIAPYGGFSEPASTGELLTGRLDMSLRVLCLWNSHTLPIEIIGNSWIVDTLSQAELDEAWAVFEHVTFGLLLPANLVERIGPAICHPRDPRIEYQDEEMKMMAPLAQKAVAWLERQRPEHELTIQTAAKTVDIAAWLNHPAFRPQERLAAGPKSKSSERRNIYVPSLEVRIQFYRVGDQIYAEAFGKNEKESNALDQVSIRDQAGNELAQFSGSTLQFYASAAKNITDLILQGTDGKRIDVTFL